MMKFIYINRMEEGGNLYFDWTKHTLGKKLHIKLYTGMRLILRGLRPVPRWVFALRIRKLHSMDMDYGSWSQFTGIHG